MSGNEKPMIYVRKQDDDEDDEEWDDSEILTAYDKAISAVKRKITRKIQKELGLKIEDVEEFLSDLETKKKNNRKKWAVGSSCRAVYSTDGQQYEAVVVKIVDNHWCVVRYVGYDNEEEVLIETLIPSKGKKAVQEQIDDSQYVLEEGECSVTEESEHEDIYQKKSQHERIKQEMPSSMEDISKFIDEEDKIFQKTKLKFPTRPPMTFHVPFPPQPPSLARGASMMKSSSMKRQEELNSMLMSWYMCGYYTGLYERGQNLQHH
ncbi:survival motor neuron protein-like [Macrosteles quadrilineatus]|uniref:survival motor neuron protein-like n=1 Tax=Macrosteles quadrilineatus TaxID=74068 RepID=UPI0023E1A68D|nr:survival motor neuron protein-like [Macrosteles quadrilineatus]